MGRVSTEISLTKEEPFVLRSVMENSIFSNVLHFSSSFRYINLVQIQSLLPMVLSVWNCSPSRYQANKINIFGGEELQEDELQITY